MFQRGRGEQPIKYKKEVKKKYPYAYWYKIHSVGGAILDGGKRISEVYNTAWQAWENAYYTMLDKEQNAAVSDTTGMPKEVNLDNQKNNL